MNKCKTFAQKCTNNEREKKKKGKLKKTKNEGGAARS